MSENTWDASGASTEMLCDWLIDHGEASDPSTNGFCQEAAKRLLDLQKTVDRYRLFMKPLLDDGILT